jgi:hypothetical protein|nr:MAG TPA: hypothetical protein [Caudoviricetes sp.]
MQFIQVGEIGKAVIVAYETDLPTPSVKFVDKYFVVSATKYVYTCKLNDSGAYAWVRVKVLPSLSNGIVSGSQLAKDVEALDANGNVVTGTLELIEKTINANGVYTAADEGKAGYSKVTVEIAGSTAENPYIATTESELEAYIAAEYKDAFVRFDNAERRITVPQSVQKYSVSELFDSYVGERTVCKYLDNWLGDDNNKTVLKYDGNKTTTVGGVNIVTVHEISIIAYKAANGDGSICRLLYAKDVHHLQDDTYISTDYTLVWVSNYVDCTLPADTITITADMQQYIRYTGWYQKGSGYAEGSEGYSTIGYLMTGLDSPYTISVAVGNILAVTDRIASSLPGNITKDASGDKYPDGSVYKVTYGGKVGDKVAVSPFAVGDALGGATVYVDTSLVPGQVDAILATLDWENAADLGENNLSYRVFNGTSPGDVTDSTELYKAYYSLLFVNISGKYTIASFSANAENPMFYTSDTGFAEGISPFTIAASFPNPDGDGTTITQDATITNIWCSNVLKKLAGKTNEFAITSYSDYYFLEQQGSVIDIGTESAMDNIATKYNMNKVYSYNTGTSKYKNGLYLITEG